MAKGAGKFVFEYLKNGTVSDANVDASASAQNFDYTATSRFTLQRLNFVMVDGGAGYGEFGGLGAALTNGLKFQVLSGSTVLEDFGTDDVPIKTNEDFGALAGVDNIIHPAAGDDSHPVRWTIAKAGKPMLIEKDQIIRMIVNDDLSDLSKFRVMIQGVEGDL